MTANAPPRPIAPLPIAPLPIAPWEQEQVTPRQRQMFATCAAKMEAETGRTLADWVVVARTCPHQDVRSIIQWLDREHGVQAMRAHILMAAAFPELAPAPEDVAAALWKVPSQKAVAEAVIAVVGAWPDVIVGQRKGYTAFSRKVQFAAIKPVKGCVRLGLGLPPEVSPRLAPRGRSETLQDRLISVTDLTAPTDFDAELQDLVARACAAA